MSLQIYNTLRRRKEEFCPAKKSRMGIYVCGPTVYDEPHIGHARSAYIFDVIVKYLRFRFKEKKVIFVRNVTDIDDKIIDRARQEPGSEELKEKAKLIAEKYLASYHEDMGALGLEKPDIEPKATETIRDMIVFIKTLMKKKYAYESSGNVYFSVRKFKEYGSLSGQSLERMLEGARVAVDKEKRDPLDFALWKISRSDEPSWESPWGKGRPGWHIECSVMSTKYLKRGFLIHGGGLDLIFPHHENEIAQTVCAGKKSADYWIHNGLLTIDGQKMSKSLGNFVSIKDILKRYHPEVLKLFFLSGHYRSPIDFTYEKMEEAKKARERFYILFDRIDRAGAGDVKGCRKQKTEDRTGEIEEFKKKFEEAMDDDFNTPLALGCLYEIVSITNKIADENPQRELLRYSRVIVLNLGGIFGLFKDKKEFKKRKDVEGRVLEAIKERKIARKRGDYKTADRIRQGLLKEGILLEDTKEGTAWRRKV